MAGGFDDTTGFDAFAGHYSSRSNARYAFLAVAVVTPSLMAAVITDSCLIGVDSKRF